jgi:hypothetical protein
VDATTDKVTEVVAGGLDSVLASATFTLTTKMGTITFTGDLAINATGSLDNDTITATQPAMSSKARAATTRTSVEAAARAS